MSDAPIITATKNGPYKIENMTEITLSDGTSIEVKRTAFLCRCGHSANKPFCDSSHKKHGWTE